MGVQKPLAIDFFLQLLSSLEVHLSSFQHKGAYRRKSTASHGCAASVTNKIERIRWFARRAASTETWQRIHPQPRDADGRKGLLIRVHGRPRGVEEVQQHVSTPAQQSLAEVLAADEAAQLRAEPIDGDDDDDAQEETVDEEEIARRRILKNFVIQITRLT